MTLTTDRVAHRLDCRYCARPCAAGQGLAAHERHCPKRPGVVAAPAVEVALEWKCRLCGRPCANGTGRAAHERACEGGDGQHRLVDTVTVLRPGEFLSGWSHLWRTGRFGTRDTGTKLRGAFDPPGTDACVGTPDGRVVPARMAHVA